MPLDFTATTLPAFQVALEEVFLGGRTTLERSVPPMTAQRLLEEQTATTTPIIRNNVCIATQVDYLHVDSVVIPTATTSAPAVNCVIPAGDGLSSAEKTYTPNLYIQETILVNDQDCDNFFKTTQKVAHLFASTMAKMAQSLNEHLIAQLVLLKDTPTFVGNGTLNVDVIDYPAADFLNPDLLADWRLIASRNFLASNYLILNGTNLNNLTYNAAFKQLDDDKRSLIAQLLAGEKLSWDLFQMDTIVGALPSFLVDPNMYAFFNKTNYTDALVEWKDANNTATFRLPLQYFVDNPDPTRRAQTFMYANNGVLQPIMVDIRYQRVCDAVITQGGRPSLTHKWSFLIEGGFDTAPATDSKSGIIQINKV